MERLKRGEREMALAAISCGIAIVQLFIGVTGGTLLTAAMLMNLALIGWIGNTAHARWKAGEGKGLMVFVCIAFVMATLSALILAEDITSILNTVETIDSFTR
jgi:hypothetical protein